MINKEILIKYKIGIEISLATILFLSIILNFLKFATVIVALLIFIVLLEVVRMVTTYVLGKEQVMKLRFIIDGFIIFFMRDLVLIFSSEKYSIIEKEEKLIMIIALIFSLFIFRIMALYFSPNDKNCNECPAIKKDELN